MEISAKYSHKDVENSIYQWWEKCGYFRAEDRSTKPPYSIVIPPPNVTGSLHMGHALDHTLQDALIRWKRMSGYNALWLPGTDHAGIATQNVVEKALKKEGLTRHQLGREKFIQRVWEWKNQYGHRIIEQMRRLGDSCDWERLAFTLDDNLSQAVKKVFVDLYHQKVIYRGQKLINWCIRCETALSDLEVEYRDSKGSLWNIDYPLANGKGMLTVATTRPETLLGDTAICVHPSDERYSSLIGQSAIVPLTERKVTIIADEYVDKEFGSGVVKITPGHDFNDYEIGLKHNLEIRNILTEKGLLNENTGPYCGLNLKEARKKILEDLEMKNLLRSEEDHFHSVGCCQRCQTVVEPFLSSQWFVKVKSLATPAQRVAESGTVTFEPSSWTKTYLHWMSIIQDWCISRQLWWGHRIPAWYCSDCSEIHVAEEAPHVCKGCGNKTLIQDEDVLDTWFSSALWPFSTMGWPRDTEAQKTFYPTNVLVTGHDIIFFWVARMMMMGLEFKKDVPFRKVYIHGLVRDSEGKKMSKSLGNSMDPVEIIESHGADALRFTLLAQVATGRDLKFSEQRLDGYRNFMNKIWNATRFSLTVLQDFKVPSEGVKTTLLKSDLSIADMWITFKLSNLTKEVELSLESFHFSDAVNSLYNFVWHDFCDWYLEFAKPILYKKDGGKEKESAQLVLAQTLNRILRLLHPFIPFITEELYQKIPIRGEALIIDSYPTVLNDSEWLSLGSEQAAFEFELVKEVVTAIRNIRWENGIAPNKEIVVCLVPSDDQVQKLLGNNKPAILRMAGLSLCDIGVASSLAKCAVTPIRIKEIRVDVVVPLEGLVNFEEEIKRINKLIEKNQKEISLISKKLSNQNYVNNAPQEIIQADQTQLQSLTGRIQSLQESLNRLK